LYQAPRGTSDILPEEQKYWRYVEQKAAYYCQLFGYERIDTPIFEDTNLFSRSAGEFTDVVQKEMYTFNDRSGNSLTLKPEGTPAVCRAYIQHGFHNLPHPVKLYYISPIFRYERPQAGRYRQHYQFGCEAIGDDDSSMDAELINIAWQLYMSLGIGNLSISLNSIGCKKCRPEYLNELKKHYSEHSDKLCADCNTRLINNPMRLLDCKQARCQPVADSAPVYIDYLCSECNNHFTQLQKYLNLLEIPFNINHRLVRGFDYYTRTVFEVQPEKEGSQSSVGGGGRYDYLIEELGGKPTPAVGFGSGIERIVLNLKRQDIDIPPIPEPDVFLAYIGNNAGEAAIKLASDLRKVGIGVIKAGSNKSLKAQLRQANTIGVHHSLIIGNEEVDKGTVILRDMINATQQSVTVDQLKDILLKIH
jgi:histidyl-tRNA synthetase